MIWWSFVLFVYCSDAKYESDAKFEDAFSGYNSYEEARRNAEDLAENKYANDCEIFITYDKYEP